MDKLETENELNIKVTNTNSNQTLIDENCCTLLTISLTNSGDVFTSFLGAYNHDILRLLKRTQKVYFRELIKKLKASKNQPGPAEVLEPKNETTNQTNTQLSTKTKPSENKKTTTKKTSTTNNEKSESKNKSTLANKSKMGVTKNEKK